MANCTLRIRPAAHGLSSLGGGASIMLAPGVAALLIGVGIAVNDSALDVYFGLASSLVAPGVAVAMSARAY